MTKDMIELLDLKHGSSIYLASPYSATEGHSKEWEPVRFQLVNIAAMALVNYGFIVFSPISHSHPIAATQPSTKNDHGLWLRQDAFFLDLVDVLAVLWLPGHRESYGVQWEVDRVLNNYTRVFDITLEDIYELETFNFNQRRAHV